MRFCVTATTILGGPPRRRKGGRVRCAITHGPAILLFFSPFFVLFATRWYRRATEKDNARLFSSSSSFLSDNARSPRLIYGSLSAITIAEERRHSRMDQRIERGTRTSFHMLIAIVIGVFHSTFRETLRRIFLCFSKIYLTSVDVSSTLIVSFSLNNLNNSVTLNLKFFLTF